MPCNRLQTECRSAIAQSKGHSSPRRSRLCWPSPGWCPRRRSPSPRAWIPRTRAPCARRSPRPPRRLDRIRTRSLRPDDSARVPSRHLDEPHDRRASGGRDYRWQWPRAVVPVRFADRHHHRSQPRERVGTAGAVGPRGVSLSLDGGGGGQGGAGAIVVPQGASLSIARSTISGNTGGNGGNGGFGTIGGGGGGGGGAIVAAGTLAISDSTVEGNVGGNGGAGGASFGVGGAPGGGAGAIAVIDTGSLSVTNSTIFGNRGGDGGAGGDAPTSGGGGGGGAAGAAITVNADSSGTFSNDTFDQNRGGDGGDGGGALGGAGSSTGAGGGGGGVGAGGGGGSTRSGGGFVGGPGGLGGAGTSVGGTGGNGGSEGMPPRPPGPAPAAGVGPHSCNWALRAARVEAEAEEARSSPPPAEPVAAGRAPAARSPAAAAAEASTGAGAEPQAPADPVQAAAISAGPATVRSGSSAAAAVGTSGSTSGGNSLPGTGSLIAAGTVRADSTVFAASQTHLGTPTNECRGEIDAGGFNLFRDGRACTRPGGDSLTGDPLFATAAPVEVAGPTKTVLLLEGEPGVRCRRESPRPCLRSAGCELRPGQRRRGGHRRGRTRASRPARTDGRGAAITTLSVSPARFRRGKRRTPAFVAAKRGTTITVSVDRASRIVLGFQRVSKSGLPISPPAGTKQRPARKKGRRSLERAAVAGENTIAFSGRIGSSLLKPGRWRVQAVAHDGALASTPVTASFKIVGG